MSEPIPIRNWARVVDTDTAHLLTGTSNSPDRGLRRYTACGHWLPASRFRKLDLREACRYEVVACASCEDACGHDIFGNPA